MTARAAIAIDEGKLNAALARFPRERAMGIDGRPRAWTRCPQRLHRGKDVPRPQRPAHELAAPAERDWELNSEASKRFWLRGRTASGGRDELEGTR